MTMPQKPDKQFSNWPSIDELITDLPNAPVALLGAPLGMGSVTPGSCHLAPSVIRSTLARISTYDVETDADLCGLSLYDAGDVNLARLNPAQSLEPIVRSLRPLTQKHDLTLLLGGNNAVTRPGVHALAGSFKDGKFKKKALENVALITLDAHFDLRPTDQGLINGNPVQALLDDGLPGAHIAQIGLAPFANSRDMAETARMEGISFYTLTQCREAGLSQIIDLTLGQLSERVDQIYVDFDIDVIERALSPGAPGGRAGGLSPQAFFSAARLISAHPKVRVVDLTEFDPSLDINSATALIAARWVAEVLMGFTQRSQSSYPL